MSAYDGRLLSREEQDLQIEVAMARALAGDPWAMLAHLQRANVLAGVRISFKRKWHRLPDEEIDDLIGKAVDALYRRSPEAPESKILSAISSRSCATALSIFSISGARRSRSTRNATPLRRIGDRRTNRTNHNRAPAGPRSPPPPGPGECAGSDVSDSGRG